MSRHFIDQESRRLFIEGLVETLSTIFNISDDVQRSALYNELSLLGDNALLEKQKLIESYLDEESLSLQGSINALVQNMHTLDEAPEKETAQNIPNFVF